MRKESAYLSALEYMTDWAEEHGTRYESALIPGEEVAEIVKTKDLDSDILEEIKADIEAAVEEEVKLPHRFLRVVSTGEYIPLEDDEYEAYNFNPGSAGRKHIRNDERALAYLRKKDKDSPSFQEAIDEAFCEAEAAAQARKEEEEECRKKNEENKKPDAQHLPGANLGTQAENDARPLTPTENKKPDAQHPPSANLGTQAENDAKPLTPMEKAQAVFLANGRDIPIKVMQTQIRTRSRTKKKTRVRANRIRRYLERTRKKVRSMMQTIGRVLGMN